jgi:hypothetical protein
MMMLMRDRPNEETGVIVTRPILDLGHSGTRLMISNTKKLFHPITFFGGGGVGNLQSKEQWLCILSLNLSLSLSVSLSLSLSHIHTHPLLTTVKILRFACDLLFYAR